ncbi:hypothetical protein [Rhodococcus sp. 2G]|uniref:hypothetical protein n=1 Tax=Rhodococcus sp. 2G TaxID=1570939 RepID=UPI0012EB98AC|nr:hypothetical protein [Rhodococcus sp. 2G]
MSTMSWRTWTTVTNPFRSNHPVDRRYAQLSRWHDQVDMYLWSAGLVCAAVLFVVLVGPLGAIPAVMAAAAVPAGSVLCVRRAYQRRLDEARDAVAALDDEVGPRILHRGRMVDASVREYGDRAAAAQNRILTSVAYEHGSLGDPDVIARHLAAATWQVIRMACELDQMTRIVNNIERSSAGQHELGEVTAADFDVADQALSERLRALQAASTALVDLADQVAELDWRLLEPAAREKLLGVAVAMPLPARDDCIDVLTGQISAAHQVLDAGGFTPPARPPQE